MEMSRNGWGEIKCVEITTFNGMEMEMEKKNCQSAKAFLSQLAYELSYSMECDPTGIMLPAGMSREMPEDSLFNVSNLSRLCNVDR